MKNLIFSLIGLFITIQSLSLFGAVREITLETKKIDDAVHWIPDTVTVTPGEKVKFVAKHDLEGGFDFHGFFIPSLKISEQVNRHKPTTIEVTIPSDMKPGEYPIGCQFHPKHVGAKLIVHPVSTTETAAKTKAKAK